MAGDMLYRQWCLLKSIPREPGRISTRQLAQALQEEDIRVSVRSVQRDLDQLSALFGLRCRTEGRTNLWSFMKEAPVLQLPVMDVHNALALLLAEQQAGALLPPAAFERLKPWILSAQEVLQRAAPPALAHWRERFRSVQRGPLLEPQPLRLEIQEAVYDAVLRGLQIEVRYQSRAGREPQLLQLHPRAIVLREGVIYTVATAGAYRDLRHYALHRFAAVRPLSTPVLPLPELDLETYVRDAFQYPLGERPLALRLRFARETGHHLLERRLSADQCAEPDGEHLVISATVADTAELRWWILGFGERVEVLAPASLREELRERIEAMAAAYGVLAPA